MPLQLRTVPGDYTIVRLEPTAPIPDWALSGAVHSITRTPTELSIFCDSRAVPSDTKHEPGWALLALVGPFPFTQVGILLAVLEPLAAARIGILALSTFDTDYVAVKQTQRAQAIEALRAAGHQVN